MSEPDIGYHEDQRTHTTQLSLWKAHRDSRGATFPSFNFEAAKIFGKRSKRGFETGAERQEIYEEEKRKRLR